MKVILHGSCSFPFFYKELIPWARDHHSDIEWRVMILSWRHREMFKGVLPDEHVFYVQPFINDAFQQKLTAEELRHYSGSIYASMQTDKGEPGQLRNREGTYQLQNGIAFYKVYKKYLQGERPDAILMPALETHEAMILYDVARELGIETILPTSARNFGGSFLSATPNEELPRYAFDQPLSAEVLGRAQDLVDQFNKRPSAQSALPPLPPPEDCFPPPPRSSLSNSFSQGLRAFKNVLRDLSHEPHAMRSNPFWYQPRVQLLGPLYALRNTKGDWQRRYFQIHRLQDLPKSFVYFPLQVTPESSINTLAPYFVDQERAVDLILYHMPSDHQLVVKEHPAMKGIRPNGFYKRLRRTPGVLLIDFDVPSHDLIRRAAMTVSVTGTATFEALLMGRPSLSLAKTFFSPWITRYDSFSTLSKDIRQAIDEPPEAILARATQSVARILTGSYDFMLADPYNPWIDARYTMNRSNLQHFLEALSDHFKRMRRSGGDR